MDRSGKGSVFQVETNGAGHRCFSIDAHLRGTRRGEGLLGPGFRVRFLPKRRRSVEQFSRAKSKNFWPPKSLGGQILIRTASQL